MCVNKKIKVAWQGEAVGYIVDPKVDMFHIYGKRAPGSGSISSEFLERLRAEEELTIHPADDTYPDLICYLDEEPDDEIDVIPYLSPHLTQHGLKSRRIKVRLHSTGIKPANWNQARKQACCFVGKTHK